MAGLRLTKICKSFGSVTTLHDIDLEIDDGEFVVFVGPSGCGKSTLLRTIAGLEEISSGGLYIGDSLMNGVPPSRRGIAMVFQSYALYPHMTVFENMAFALKLSGMSKDRIHEIVLHTARILHIESLLERKPRQLSGGQRQRVAIGRAIVRKPEVFLFDEPLSNLDTSLRAQMRVELAALHRELGTTMIYVTHDQVEAMTLADRIVVLNGGRIEQIGAPLELYHRPANRFVASFLGSPPMNFLSGTVGHSAGKLTSVRLAGDIMIDAAIDEPLPAGAPITVGIRPEHLHKAGGQGIPVVVRATEHLGDATYVYATVDHTAEKLVIRSAPESRWTPGERVILQVAPTHAHVFDQDGRALARFQDRGPSTAV